MRTAISTSSSFLCQFPRRRRDYLVVTYTPGNTKTRFSWLPVKSPKATNLNVTKAGGVPWSMVGSDRWSRGKEEEPGRPCHVPWPRDATDDARGFLLLIPFFDIKPLDLVNLDPRQSFSFSCDPCGGSIRRCGTADLQRAGHPGRKRVPVTNWEELFCGSSGARPIRRAE